MQLIYLFSKNNLLLKLLSIKFFKKKHICEPVVILTLTALHIFCYLYENNKIYVIFQAINDIIFLNRVIIRNCRMTPGVLKTL